MCERQDDQRKQSQRAQEHEDGYVLKTRADKRRSVGARDRPPRERHAGESDKRPQEDDDSTADASAAIHLVSYNSRRNTPMKGRLR